MTYEKTTRLPMTCTCGPERRNELRAAREDLMRKLDPEAVFSNEQWDRHFVTIVMHSFNKDFARYYDLHHINVDQWFSIGVTGNDEFIHLNTDTVEDGLVAIWLYLYDTYGLDSD